MKRMTRHVVFSLSLCGISFLGSPRLCFAQSGIVSWGDVVFDSRWNNEPFVEISARGGHTVARRSDGSVVAWGDNQQGQCNVPALPPGLTYVQIAAGTWHTVALRSDGSVVAWGFNFLGQCNVPALPHGLTYVQVAAAFLHSAARRSDGLVVAWGDNGSGQCTVPPPPPGLTYVEVVAGGGWDGAYKGHTVARLSNGSVVAWGDNSYGQCNVPAPPPGLSYTEVAAGWFHTLARRSDGSVIARGDNSFGQCNIPIPPPGLSFVDVSASRYNSLLLLSNGSVVVRGLNIWGLWNVPVLPSGLTYVEVAAGENHMVGRRSDGLVVAWGVNSYAECNVPVPPPGFNYVGVDAGGYNTVARQDNGSVVAWGWNLYGECNIPAPPPGLSYVQVATDWYHTVVRRSDGLVLAYGDNTYHQCDVPPLPPGLTYLEVAAGGGYDTNYNNYVGHSLARRSDGEVVAWGSNGYGQCNVPSLPSGLTYVEVAAGSLHSAARRSDGLVVAWGDNGSGQCTVPPPPPGLTYVEVVAGGGWDGAYKGHTVARLSNGSVVAWGDNSYHQCDVLALPPGLTYVEIAAGDFHTVARRSNGVVVAWGRNYEGQCNVPAPPPGLTYVELAADARRTVARFGPTGNDMGTGTDGGNSPSVATVIHAPIFGQGTVGGAGDDQDNFRVVVQAPTVLTVTLTPPQNVDIDVDLLCPQTTDPRRRILPLGIHPGPGLPETFSFGLNAEAIIRVHGRGLTSPQTYILDITSTSNSDLEPDPPPSLKTIFVDSPNKYSRTPQVNRVVLHTMQGSLRSAVCRFNNNCENTDRVSAHYLIGSDGAIVQMVKGMNVAKHAGNGWYNEHSIGIEHEGKAEDATTWTPALVDASTQLTLWLSTLTSWNGASYSITKTRQFIIGHCEVPRPYEFRSIGNYKTCPGPYLPWQAYMNDIGGNNRIWLEPIQIATDVDARTGPDSNALPLNHLAPTVSCKARVGQQYVKTWTENGWCQVFFGAHPGWVPVSDTQALPTATGLRYIPQGTIPLLVHDTCGGNGQTGWAVFNDVFIPHGSCAGWYQIYYRGITDASITMNNTLVQSLILPCFMP